MGRTATPAVTPAEQLDRPSPLHGALRGVTYCDGDSWWAGCGYCGACGGPVPKAAQRDRDEWFCRLECRRWWRANHMWQYARAACIRRDRRRCVRCHRRESTAASRRRVARGERIEKAGAPLVRLEVNHKTPLDGRRDGYATGCQHHLDGLETLCEGCHAEVTADQERDRRERPDPDRGAPPRLVRPEVVGPGGCV